MPTIIKLLIVFLISMIPLIELRGAVPIAVGAFMDLPKWAVLITAILGNMLPVPLIYYFSRRFLEWGQHKKHIGKFCRFCLKKGEKGGQKLQKKAGQSVYFALFLFVALPIPGTGAWTGTLAASILDLNFKRTVISILAGILVAGAIMLAVSLGLFSLIFH